MPVRIRLGFFVLSVSLLTAMSLSAQNYPKVEVPLGFSFINVHPNITPISSFNIFGGGGGFVYNFTPILGVKADFMGYTQGNGLKSRLTNAGYVVNGDVQGNLFTYMFGPQFKKHTGRLQPFGEALFGAAHSNTYASIFNTIHGVSGSSNNNAFAMAFGGGLDFVVGRNVQVRPFEVDYLYTRFGINGTSYTGNQNNFRYVGGLNFTFGGAPPVPPTASCSASPTEILAGAPVTATISTQNFNPKHTVTYKWSGTGGKVSGTGTTGTVDTTGLAPGNYTVSGAATDAKEKKNNVASCSASFTVKQPLPPVVSCSASPTTLAIGQPSTVTMSARDPQGWPLTYSWTATGGQLSGSGTSATLTATSTDAGNSITITGTATDDHGLSSSCTASVNVPPVSEKCTMIEDWGECTFEKNPKKPWRVDNDCKDVLDKLSLRLQQMPNGKLNIVGYTNQEEVVHEQTLGSQRSVNVKYYLTTDGPNKVDASRLQPRQGEAKGQATHFYFVPEGKLCGGQLEEGTVVDESQVQPQSRTAPVPSKKHKKAPAAAPAQ
jgi:hypothetical protein